MLELYPSGYEEIDKSLEQIIVEHMEPASLPAPELSLEARSSLFYRMYAIIAMNGKRGMIMGEGDYYTTFSRVSDPLFEPDFTDIPLAMKVWEHKGIWAQIDVEPEKPIYRISYSQIVDENRLRLASQPLISIEFRAVDLDVPVFIPAHTEVSKRDKSLTDARAWQLISDMQNATTFQLPSDFQEAA